MSIHKSFKAKDKWKRNRNVRKRYERIRSLHLQEKWDKEHNSVFALPKEKIKKYKVKKDKKKKEEETPLTPLMKPTKK